MRNRNRVTAPKKLAASTVRVNGDDVVGLAVHRQGVYASSPLGDFLDREALPGVRVVAVTTGVGMTTCHGFAASAIDSVNPKPSSGRGCPEMDAECSPRVSPS